MNFRDMRKLEKEIEDFRSDDSSPEALTWQHSAACIGLALLWQLVDSVNDVFNEMVEANDKP